MILPGSHVSFQGCTSSISLRDSAPYHTLMTGVMEAEATEQLAA